MSTRVNGAERTAIRDAEHEQQRTLVELIGAAVAVAVADVLGQQAWQPACLRCVREAKVSYANALAAAEPPPAVEVRQSVTVTAGGPACWDHA